MQTKRTLLRWQINLLIIFIIDTNSPTMGQVSNESCTKIVDKFIRAEVSLYENTIINSSDFKKISNADEFSKRNFVVPEKNNCFFELCSYQKYYDSIDVDLYFKVFPDDSIFCQLYNSENGSIYDVLSAVKVSSVACYCPVSRYFNLITI